MMTTPNRTAPRQRQQGVVAVMAAVMMVTLIMFLAVVVDTGRIFLEKRSLQKNADLAALETALLYCRDQDASLLDSYADIALRGPDRNNFAGDGIIRPVKLGRVESNGAGGRTFSEDATGKAVEVVLEHSISASLFQRLWPGSMNDINLRAEAVAQACEPIVQLSIKSNIASVNDGVLLSLLGVPPGDQVAIGADSLIDANITLLSYLDALAPEIGISAGNYDAILSSNVSISTLLEVAANVISPQNSNAEATLRQIVNLAPNGLPDITLGDILSISSASQPEALLQSGINLLGLTQAAIQLGTGENVANIDLPVTLPGLATLSVKAKAIETAQISAIGNPESDEIFVRTAQIRALASVDLGEATGIVNDLTDALSPFLNPIINFLNSAGYGGLNLLGSVVNLLEDVFNLLGTICNGNCPSRNVSYTEILPLPLQISIEAGAASAAAGNTILPPSYACEEGKSLKVARRSSLAKINMGTMDESQVFSADESIEVEPFPLVEIGYRQVRPRRCFIILGLGECTDEQWRQENNSWLTNGKSTAKRNIIAGLGLKVSSPTSITDTSSDVEWFESPDLPEVGQGFQYKNETGVSVSNLISPLDIEIIPYASTERGVLGSTLTGTLSLLNNVIDELTDTITGPGGILDIVGQSLVDDLLASLGVGLSGTEVGAAMTCENDKVRLVM